MIKLDHLTIYAADYVASRDWYVSCFGLHVAFDSALAGVCGLEDDGGVELILVQRKPETRERDCALTFQCESVHEMYRKLSARGVAFVHEPKDVPWGYGAELKDPDSYPIRLWDKMTMPGYQQK